MSKEHEIEQAEIDVTYDQLIDQIVDRSREERARKSDAGESASKLKEFLGKTSVNSQAFSWCKTIFKKLEMKDGNTKAMDIIQSLEACLPLIKNFVEGQQPSLDLEAEEQADDDEQPEPEEKPTTEKSESKKKADLKVVKDEEASEDFGEVENDAYTTGQNAHAAGKDRDANPFDEDKEPTHFRFWNQGWDAAAEQAAFDEEVDEAMAAK